MKKKAAYLNCVPMFSYFIFLVVSVTLLLLSNQESSRRIAFFKEMNAVAVISPKDIPDLTQDNIDIAMVLFGIERNKNIVSVTYDANIEDRGLTTGGLTDPSKTVLIGPAAFTSWSVLGSTLGHEIEIHGNQSFFKIFVKDRFVKLSLAARKQVGKFVPLFRPSASELFEDEGTWAAEREAYQYEIDAAKRFGLEKQDLKSIHQVINLYYPEKLARR